MRLWLRRSAIEHAFEHLHHVWTEWYKISSKAHVQLVQGRSISLPMSMVFHQNSKWNPRGDLPNRLPCGHHVWSLLMYSPPKTPSTSPCYCTLLERLDALKHRREQCQPRSSLVSFYQSNWVLLMRTDQQTVEGGCGRSHATQLYLYTPRKRCPPGGASAAPLIYE